MSYTRTDWNCGDTITADRMNNIEDGIEEALECCGGGSEPLVVGMTVEEGTPSAGQITYTLDKTWQEITDAFPNAYVQYQGDRGITYKYPIIGLFNNESAYGVATVGSITSTINTLSFATTSADGYPTYVEQGGN